MPFITCSTNLSKESLPKDFVEWISELVSQVLGKPMERINTMLVPDLSMMRSGNSDPTMIIQIHSIGVFDAERNPSYTEKLIKAIHEKVNLPENRVVLQYFPVDPTMIGHVQ